MGSEGWQVKRLQRLLRQNGCFPEPAAIDGDFGEITEAAVRAFQELNDLNVDGLVGKLTWRALLTADAAEVPTAEALQPAYGRPVSS
jgi:peptidoglycan hydrolase-like protein with peptidoglycan-binding domain